MIFQLLDVVVILQSSYFLHWVLSPMHKRQCCWKTKFQYCEANSLNVASLAETVESRVHERELCEEKVVFMNRKN